MADLQSFKNDIQSLVKKFDQDKNHYLQKGYPEAQVRIDFLNPFFDSSVGTLKIRPTSRPMTAT